ncbi:MAG: uridine diphosphate-N-acetylglucosamine-binding protein YvcK [Corallincola sp.]|nr:uridine diphosphate-N-acetylglucosamine-binding protein YvcK [Corallincola sp.]
MQAVVTIGGGSGQFNLLSALRDLDDVELTAVVSMTDSGGSTGRLRDELGILPPGDVLKCILALSPLRDVARDLLLKRFESTRRLQGHTAGNMLLTMLSQYVGSFAKGVEALAELLNVQGRILPVTVDKATLVAELESGERLFGEHAIDVPRGPGRSRIANVFLVPHHADEISVYPPVLEAIANADVVLIGPGDLYTSIVPSLLVPGVAAALRDTGARLIYISNIMTKYGETEGYAVEDFLAVLQRYIGRPVPEVIYNTHLPSPELLARYACEHAAPVQLNNPGCRTLYVHAHDLIEDGVDLLRHDAAKLAQVLRAVLAGNGEAA